MAHYSTDSFLMIIVDPSKLHPFTKNVLEEVVGVDLQKGIPVLDGKLAFEVQYGSDNCGQDIDWTEFFELTLGEKDSIWYSNRVSTTHFDSNTTATTIVEELIRKGTLEPSFLTKMGSYYSHIPKLSDYAHRQFFLVMSDFNNAIDVTCTNSFYSSYPLRRDGVGADINFVSDKLCMFTELEDINQLATTVNAAISLGVEETASAITEWVRNHIIGSVLDEKLQKELLIRFGEYHV